jgi:hypothetical protein
MTATATITLGGRNFDVATLTFRQLRGIEEALGRAAKPGAPGADFDVAVDIVAAALSRAYPEMNREAILDLEGSKSDIVTAVRALLRFAGYSERETAPGEARAGN